MNLSEEEKKEVIKVMESQMLTLLAGNVVKNFEKEFANYIGVKNAIGVNSGTAALHIAIAALEIGPGDEIIVPPFTFIATASSILQNNAIPIFADIDNKTYTLDPDSVKKQITNKTKAFMTVDLKGMPVDYDAFVALSKETGIPFISDSAESLGAIYKDQKVGNQAMIHSFSFFANKNITTGEGGMVTTTDKELYEKLLIIRNQGQEGRYNHTWLGNNYRLTDIQAAFGIEQLRRIDWLLSEKQKLADRYTKAFSNTEDIDPPFVPDFVRRHSWYMYSIKVDANKRDGLIEQLHTKNIDTRLSFPPIHIQPYYKKRFGYSPRDFPIAYNTF